MHRGEPIVLAWYAHTDSEYVRAIYADQLVPIDKPRTRAYLDRLLARPSMIRVRREAEPYWHNFPGRRS